STLLGQDDLAKRVNALEAQMNQLNRIIIPDVENALSTVVQSKAQSDSATIMLINRINAVQNKIKILEDKAAYSDSTNLEILEQLVMIENKIVSLARSFNELYSMKTTPEVYESPKLSSGEFKQRYVDALSKYQNGQYEDAIQGFSTLAYNQSDHPLADNSQYWLGECYYSLKNYKRAILEFEKVMQFSKSDKQDDSMLKLGLCFMKIGNNQRARAEFRDLLELFPNSEYSQRAQQYLRQL
ncbi:MAG: tol-pal system protein YbgF, partial [Fidelibacterota bacterium]